MTSTSVFGQLTWGTASSQNYDITNSVAAIDFSDASGALCALTTAGRSTLSRRTAVSVSQANRGRITIQEDGLYEIIAYVEFQGNNGNTVSLEVYKNGAALTNVLRGNRTALTGSLRHGIRLGRIEPLQAGDYITATLLSSAASETLGMRGCGLIVRQVG